MKKDMEKKKEEGTNAERCLCAVLGIAIGMLTVFAMQWPWWAMIPACTIGAGLAFRPLDLLKTLRAEIAPRLTMENARFWGEGIFLCILLLCAGAASVLTVVTLPTLALCADSILRGTPWFENDPFAIGLMVFMIGGGWLWAGRSLSDHIRERRAGKSFAFPLSRRLPEWMLLRLMEGEMKGAMAFVRSFSLVCLSQLHLLFSLPLFIADLILTVGIAAATTQRLSVMCGGALGGARGGNGHAPGVRARVRRGRGHRDRRNRGILLVSPGPMPRRTHCASAYGLGIGIDKPKTPTSGAQSPEVFLMRFPYTLCPCPTMPKVRFIQADGTVTEVDAPEGKSILHIALDAGIPMEHACGGNGFCTTCMCRVKEGMQNLSPRNDREENMGVTEDPDRLSCQSEVRGDVAVEVIEY